MSLDNFKKARDTWEERLGFLEIELAKEADASKKFSINQHIKECNLNITRLNKLIDDKELTQEDFFLLDLPPGNHLGDLESLYQKQYPVVRNPISIGTITRDKFSAHLIVAVFWGVSRKKILVQAERCYGHPDQDEVIKEPALIHDQDYELTLSEFPEHLNLWVNETIKQLDKIYRNTPKPWDLTIQLFLPVDLLNCSLKSWCGQDSKLPHRYAIIVRCSDRFDHRLKDKAYFYNQLKKGREQLKKKLSLDSRMELLAWLRPNSSCTEDLEKYEGIQCLGEWLKPGQENLKQWADLVQSGVPLALWMCEYQGDYEVIIQTFDCLAKSDWAGFLTRIREERRRPCAVTTICSGYHLGVFYEHEDSHYEPTTPPFFTHP